MNLKKNYYLGIDIGSTTFKAVVLTANKEILHETYQRTKPMESGHLACTGKCTSCGRCNMGAIKKTVETFLAEVNLKFEDMACIGVTGSQIVEDTRKFIPFDFQISEVSAHVTGAKHFVPDADAIIDCGGQDSKCMVYDPVMDMRLSMMSSAAV